LRRRTSSRDYTKAHIKLEIVMGFYIGVTFMYLLSFLFVAFPERIVSRYASRFRTEDEKLLTQMDRLQVFNPFSKFLVGKASDFATNGSEHPETFPRMVWFVRLIGLVPMIGLTIALIYFSQKR
jgi:hypothetical protein